MLNMIINYYKIIIIFYINNGTILFLSFEMKLLWHLRIFWLVHRSERDY